MKDVIVDRCLNSSTLTLEAYNWNADEPRKPASIILEWRQSAGFGYAFRLGVVCSLGSDQQSPVQTGMRYALCS
jgi:hypothetical protein